MLQQLSEALGVSGHEQEVRDLIYRHVRPLADEVRVDTIGNLTAYKKARRAATAPAALRVMVAAHMDEIGFMVTGIESSGALRFVPVGGVDPRVVLGKQVVVGKDRLPGVIGCKPIHLQDEGESKKVIPFDELWIDMGVTSKDDLGESVKVGDYGTFKVAFQELGRADEGEGRRVVLGKALDDRAGCAQLIELLRDEYPFDLYAVFTVQEEVGLRGARVAAYHIAPDAAFVLETTVCDDLPKKKDVSPVTRLGAGPAITLADRSVIAAKGLVGLLRETAEHESIPYQLKAPGAGGTDAGAIHLVREGIPSAVLSTPCRYIHSMAGLMSLDDFEAGLRLMRAALQRLTAEHLKPA